MSAVLQARKPQSGPIQVWVGFELGGQRYAVDIRRVREVLSQVVIEQVPGAPRLVVGVINLRGRIVTVFDLHCRLGVQRDAGDVDQGCVIVVEVDGEPIALRVDRITELCNLQESAIRPAPRITPGVEHAVVAGMVRRGDDLLTLLELDVVINEA